MRRSSRRSRPSVRSSISACVFAGGGMLVAPGHARTAHRRSKARSATAPGRRSPDALVEIWQANAGGQVPPSGRGPADRPMRPCVRRLRPDADRRRRAVRVHDDDAGPRARAATARCRRRIWWSACSRAACSRGSSRACTSRTSRRTREDPVLALVPEGRRATLIARRDGRGPLPFRHRAPGTGRDRVLRCLSDPSRTLRRRCTLLRPSARLQAMLDVEAALAEAEAALGVIPAVGRDADPRGGARELYDSAAIAAEARRAGNLAIPLVHHLTTARGARPTPRRRATCTGAPPARTSSTPRSSSSCARRFPAIAARSDSAPAEAAAGHARAPRRHARWRAARGCSRRRRRPSA